MINETVKLSSNIIGETVTLSDNIIAETVTLSSNIINETVKLNQPFGVVGASSIFDLTFDTTFE